MKSTRQRSTLPNRSFIALLAACLVFVWSSTLFSCCLGEKLLEDEGAATENCPMSNPAVRKFATVDELSLDVGKLVSEVANKAAGKEKFFIALSGGSLPKLLAQGLMQYKDSIDFSTWHVFFADERHVPHDHPDSNMLLCQKEFLDKIPGVKPDQVYGIDASVTVEQAAVSYQANMEKVTGLSQAKGEWPRFDIIMLGMGPDGHTCSLFPGHPLLQESTSWIAPISDSPKPPPERITMTYPLLNNAENVYFLAAGGSKVDVIPVTAGLSLKGLEDLGEEALPAARVRPTNGNLVWFVDNDAAAKL